MDSIQKRKMEKLAFCCGMSQSLPPSPANITKWDIVTWEKEFS